MQSRLDAERIIANWERRMLSPNELAEFPCDCCGLPIDEPYKIGNVRYCSDCAHEMCKSWIDDGAEIECEGCGGIIPDDEPYYDVGNENYCSECFEKYFKEN